MKVEKLMVVTDADEKDFAKMTSAAMGLLKAGLGRTGSGTPVFLLRYPDGSIQKMPFPEEYGKLMNHGKAKDAIFATVRSIVRSAGITAVCFGTEAWSGKQTKAGMAVPQKEFLKATRERGFQRAVDMGWVERQECLVVTLQTETMLRTVTQPFERDDTAHTIWYVGEPRIQDAPQSYLVGRQKMYGDLREENLG
jgi:hypothetical protein